MKKSLTALAMSTALLATACFVDDSADGRSGSNGTGDNGGNRVTIAHMSTPSAGLSPLSDDAFMLANWATAETLVRLDEKGSAEPLLATEWTQEDDTTWRFSIREGVTFHDGTTLDACSDLCLQG